MQAFRTEGRVLRQSGYVQGTFVLPEGARSHAGRVACRRDIALPVGLNQTRLGPHERLDVRADKDWAFTRWKITLYGELLNLTNHYNGRYAYPSGIDPNTGRVQVKTLEGWPITPTAGLVFQF